MEGGQLARGAGQAGGVLKSETVLCVFLNPYNFKKLHIVPNFHHKLFLEVKVRVERSQEGAADTTPP